MMSQYSKVASVINKVYKGLKTSLNNIANKIKNPIVKKLKKYDWFNQLDEASQYKIRASTLVSSFFINILSLAFPLSLMQVYDRVIPNRSYSTLFFLFLTVGIAVLLETVLRISRAYINLWADTKYENKLSTNAFLKLMHIPLYLYEKTDVGTRIKQFAILDQLRGFYNNQLLVSICEIPFLIIFLIVIAYIGGWLVFVPIFLSALLMFISFDYVNKWRSFLNEKLIQESKESDFLVNVLGSIHTVKSLGIENLLIRRYERIQDYSDDINYHSSLHQGDMISLKSMTNQVNIVLMGSFGALAVMAGDIAVGSLIAVILLSGRFMLPLVRFATAFSRWKTLNIIRTQLDSVLSLPVQEADDRFELIGKIQLKNISYEYKESEFPHLVLDNIYLEIEACNVVSIIGDSQESKEMLLNILATITQPTTGEYYIDNKNVNEIHNYHLRSKISYISKIGSLFEGTILDNLSAFDETLIPEAREFAKKIGLHEIISRLPAGYDTLVGDKAVEALPGGVINMIYIIRALVNKPKIILFDESNLNLDVGSTRKLVELLKMIKSKSTTIILAKSQVTQSFSDVVYEIKNKQLIKVTKNGNE